MKKFNFSYTNNKLKYKSFIIYVSIMSDRLNIEIERIKKLLECPICFEKYVNPKILPCSHTFCLRCLIPVNRKIICPMCRIETIVPNAGTIGLTSNRQISDLLEIDLINTDINILNNLSNHEEVS
jgi:hypothetical protein